MDLVYPGPPNPHVWTRCVLCPVNFFTSRLSSVQLLSCVQLFLTPWTAARQASLSITNSWSLPKLISIESVMPSNRLILCHPLLLPPSIFPRIRAFSSESALCIRWPEYWSFTFNINPSSDSVLCVRWPKYWHFNFSLSPCNAYSRLITSRIDWFDLLADKGILKSFLQHHSSKASILRYSAFLMVQLSYPYMTSVKTIPLTTQTFLAK